MSRYDNETEEDLIKEYLVSSLNKEERLLKSKIEDIISEYVDVSNATYKKIQLLLSVINMSEEDVEFMTENFETLNDF